MTGHIYWDPPREAFSIPFIDFPIYWYSLLFAIGFYGAVLIVQTLIETRAKLLAGSSGIDPTITRRYGEKLAIFAFLGMLIGARLGHVLFYDFSHYLQTPLEILNFRRGGLSSHGAIAGIVISFFYFSRHQVPNYLPRGKDLLDIIAIGSAWAAGCIRIGNFLNQEIVGTPTEAPWAIIFGSPSDALGGIPRHPTQLYEAMVAFLLFAILLGLGKRYSWTAQGRITGWYLLVLFTCRFLLEFIKVAQCEFDTSGPHMGQLLSIPLLLWSLYLIIFAGRDREVKEQSELPHAKCSHNPRVSDEQ